MPVSLDDQIACVRRELALRRSVYRRRVLDKKMTPEAADRELVHMEAVLETLNAGLAQSAAPAAPSDADAFAPLQDYGRGYATPPASPAAAAPSGVEHLDMPNQQERLHINGALQRSIADALRERDEARAALAAAREVANALGEEAARAALPASPPPAGDGEYARGQMASRKLERLCGSLSAKLDEIHTLLHADARVALVVYFDGHPDRDILMLDKHASETKVIDAINRRLADSKADNVPAMGQP